MIAVVPTFEWGGFYSGTRRQFSLDVTLRARPGVIIYTSTEFNKVDLPETEFNTRCSGSRRTWLSVRGSRS